MNDLHKALKNATKKISHNPAIKYRLICKFEFDRDVTALAVKMNVLCH